MHKAILAILGILIISAAIYIKLNPANIKPAANLPITSNSSPQPTNTSQTKTYQSKSLKIEIQIPTKSTVDQSFTTLTIKQDNSTIITGRSGTNFSSLNGYLTDFDSRRQLQISSSKDIIINSYNSTARIENFNAGPISQQKVYYIFVDSWVYSLSTSAPELYADLDQIAQSFKYLP